MPFRGKKIPLSALYCLYGAVVLTGEIRIEEIVVKPVIVCVSAYWLAVETGSSCGRGEAPGTDIANVLTS